MLHYYALLVLTFSLFSLQGMNNQEQPHASHLLTDDQKNEYVLSSLLRAYTQDEARKKVEELKERNLINHPLPLHNFTLLFFVVGRLNFSFHLAGALLNENTTQVNIRVGELSPLRQCIHSIELSEFEMLPIRMNPIANAVSLSKHDERMEQYKKILVQLIQRSDDYAKDIHTLTFLYPELERKIKKLLERAECA
jgi:hypothetical protein